MAVVIPPAVRDAWSFSGSDFYVEVSNNNRHRRATVPELKAVYDGVDGSKDRPAHWYEAQLIHYGLPPSKNKGTAKMRLFDAVNKGNLSVPSSILKVESDLKKEWTKRDRELKQALKKQSTAGPSKAPTKRKADDTQINYGTNVQVNVSLSIGPQGNVQVNGTLPAGPATKKAKTAITKKASTVKAADKTNAPSKSKAAAKPRAATAADTKPKAPSKAGPKAPTSKTTTPAAKSKANTSKPPASKAKATPAPKSTGTKATRPQTARRGGHTTGTSSSAGSRGASNSNNNNRHEVSQTPSHWDLYNEPPPPYPGSPIDNHDCDHDSSGRRDDTPLPALGLLNGRYRLESDGPRGDDSGIIFTLDGNALWGTFEIGPLSGVLRLDQRPYQPSHDRLYFKWRGEDIQGGEHFEPNDGSFIQFLGGGRVRGEIGYWGGMLKFGGTRLSGQGTRSELSAFEVRDRWERYN
ncbi:hypothetical protein QBC43DRAFT_223836 [Cladorrhinum sp. PSN259]|nr:hypothetical protein QBC43DRAFT_223836 [Cladorrhinum sp. PSN259]